MRLTINPIGGLANRMRAIASGVALAEECGVDFRIVWLRNWEINARLEDVFLLPKHIAERVEYPDSLKYNMLYSAPRKKTSL